MLKPGTFYTLIIKKRRDFGVYLSPEDSDERILLPKKEVPEGASVGDAVKVFVYLDSEDRPIATTNTPKLALDEVRALTVKDVSKVGAFLDWGLVKDLFLPYREMTRRLNPGDEVLVRLYIDKSGRLAASMKRLYHYLSSASPYGAGDEVQGRIYEFGHDFGTFVAVDDIYQAMIPRHEDIGNAKIGDVVTCRVTAVKEDGKLDITLRKKAHEMMDEDAEKVLGIIDAYAGVLPFTEKASPEVIRRECGLSKNAFKRAVGRLYKNRQITISEEGRIRRVQ